MLKITDLLTLRGNAFEKILSWLMVLLAIGTVLFLAWHLDVYYDEAYTYRSSRLSKVTNIFAFRIANIHVLNSLLMVLSTAFFPYVDFALRVPAVLSALIYAALALKVSQQFKARFAALALLLYFDYLLLFHSLARGYGLSATLILGLIYVFQNQEKFKKPLLWLLWLPLLAFYANFVILPFILCFYAYFFAVPLKLKWPNFKKSTYISFSLLLALGVFGFYRVSSNGKPLYGAYQADFWEAIPTNLYLHFTPFGHPAKATVVVVVVLLVMALIWQNLKHKWQKPLGLITLASFALIAFLAFLGNKPLPTGRALLPYWPLIALSLLQALAWPVRQGFTRYLAVADVMLALILMANTVLQIPYERLYQNHQSQWQLTSTALAKGAYQHKNNLSYYLKQERLYHNTYSKLSGLKADSVYGENQLAVSHYDTVNLALVKINGATATDSLCKRYFVNGKELKQQCFPLNDSTFTHNNEHIYYQYYGKSSANQVSLYLKKNPQKKVTIRLGQKGTLKALNIIYWEAREGEKTGSNLPPD